MSSDLEDFLASVREAEDPTLADERRVLRAVQEAVAAGAVVGAAAASTKLTRLWAWSAGGSFKTGGAVFVVVAAAAAAIAALTGEPAQAPAVLRARVPAPAIASAPAQTLPAPLAEARSAAPQAPESARRPPAAVVPIPARSAPAPEVLTRASLRDELVILARAQAALRRGDAAAALTALDTPSGRSPQLAAERATLRILSLCALGRIADARRTASVLERREPGSLQRDVISRSCAASSAGSLR